MEEKHRSVKNLRADTSKANPGSQKAGPVNAWLLAQGSYKRPKPLLIKPQQAKLQQSWQASKTSNRASKYVLVSRLSCALISLLPLNRFIAGQRGQQHGTLERNCSSARGKVGQRTVTTPTPRDVWFLSQGLYIKRRCGVTKSMLW